MMVTHISSSPANLFRCGSGNTAWVFLEERLFGKGSIYTADVIPQEPMGWKNCCHLLIRTKQGQFTHAHTFNRILPFEKHLQNRNNGNHKQDGGNKGRYIDRKICNQSNLHRGSLYKSSAKARVLGVYFIRIMLKWPKNSTNLQCTEYLQPFFFFQTNITKRVRVLTWTRKQPSINYPELIH